MEKYQETDGDLIKLAQKGTFDVIAHGCNCQCIMGAGIAPQMAKAFGALDADKSYEKTLKETIIDFHRSQKLGNIDSWNPFLDLLIDDVPEELIVVNAYTQYDITGRAEDVADVDYEAIALCMRKLNYTFSGKHIGLPRIGCGLAGGDWNRVKAIIQNELKDCTVTIINYKPYVS